MLSENHKQRLSRIKHNGGRRTGSPLNSLLATYGNAFERTRHLAMATRVNEKRRYEVDGNGFDSSRGLRDTRWDRPLLGWRGNYEDFEEALLELELSRFVDRLRGAGSFIGGTARRSAWRWWPDKEVECCVRIGEEWVIPFSATRVSRTNDEPRDWAARRWVAQTCAARISETEYFNPGAYEVVMRKRSSLAQGVHGYCQQQECILYDPRIGYHRCCVPVLASVLFGVIQLSVA